MYKARVVELADTLDLGSSALGLGGSSPPSRKYSLQKNPDRLHAIYIPVIPESGFSRQNILLAFSKIQKRFITGRTAAPLTPISHTGIGGSIPVSHDQQQTESNGALIPIPLRRNGAFGVFFTATFFLHLPSHHLNPLLCNLIAWQSDCSIL